MSEKLKPCPFCGKRPAVDRIEAHEHTHFINLAIPDLPDHEGSFWVECCVGIGATTREGVIKAWNTRAPMQHKPDSEVKHRPFGLPSIHDAFTDPNNVIPSAFDESKPDSEPTAGERIIASAKEAAAIAKVETQEIQQEIRDWVGDCVEPLNGALKDKIGNTDSTTQHKPACVSGTIGKQATKIKGYPFPGEVRADFTNRAGERRLVVEAIGEEYAGMLHIFSPNQLEISGPDIPETGESAPITDEMAERAQRETKARFDDDVNGHSEPKTHANAGQKGDDVIEPIGWALENPIYGGLLELLPDDEHHRMRMEETHDQQGVPLYSQDTIDRLQAELAELKDENVELRVLDCDAGCTVFTGGERKHLKTCKYYPESFTKIYDDLKAQLATIRAETIEECVGKISQTLNTFDLAANVPYLREKGDTVQVNQVREIIVEIEKSIRALSGGE